GPAPYTKDLLLQIAPTSVEAEKPIGEVLGSIQRRLSDLKERLQDLKLDKAENLSVARNPHFLVPFTSDPDFVNRSDIWTWIEEQYAGPGSRFALVGMGGFGKSQMAIQFAHQLHATSSETSIFWVNANTKATFEESYRSIADVLALPGRHDTDVNILALVRKWLQREDVSPWLMIIDNADDVKMLFSKDGIETYQSYLPKRTKSKILVTSRSRDAAERLTGNVKMVYTVPTMEGKQALQLLQRKLGRDVNEAVASRLIRTLECIPLAINQAAAYIHKRSPRVTIESYLEEFHNSEQRKGTLLRSDRGDIQRYEGVSNSVVVTWQVTFEQIKQEQPRAADLLSLMSYFQAQNIPEYMLHNYSSGNIGSEESDDEHAETSSNDFEDDLDVLRSYSLVTVSAMPGFLEMHSLAQFCTKVWISEYGQEHPSTLTSMANLASTYRNQGRWKEAEELEVRVIEMRKRVLREEHPSTLMSMANLALTTKADGRRRRSSLTFWKQGRWKEAEELNVRVIETRKRVLREEHPSTLTSMHNLSFTWKDQERWEDAVQLLRNCVRRRENVLGVDHPDTMSSASALSDWELDFGETSHKFT
ncbi:Kinesin light chain 5, partial [Colletotrichum kahawae]